MVKMHIHFVLPVTVKSETVKVVSLSSAAVSEIQSDFLQQKKHFELSNTKF